MVQEEKHVTSIFYPWDTRLPEIDAKDLGGILISFQELSNALGQYCKGDVTLKGAGQWIQFAGHDKTYLLTSDLTTDGAGHAVADFQPSLYEPIALNEQAFISNIHFKVRADSDFHKFTIQPGQLYTFSVSFVESIR